MAAVSEKRVFRLQQFFQSYPHLNPQVGEDFSIPVVVIQAPRRLFRFRPKSAEVYVSPALLQEGLPSWIEATVLHCALRLYQRERGFRSIPVEQERPYQKLQSIIETGKRSSTQPRAQTASNEILKAAWQSLRLRYFANRPDLDNYLVQWASRKRIRLLATCNITNQVVVVAPAMNQPGCLELLGPLLYHEMCHAALGVPKVVNGRAIYHGREFRALEQKHPEIQVLDRWIRQGGWDKAVENYELKKQTVGRVPVFKAEPAGEIIQSTNTTSSQSQTQLEGDSALQLHMF